VCVFVNDSSSESWRRETEREKKSEEKTPSESFEMGVCKKLLDQLLQDVAVQAETTVPKIIHSLQSDLILLENYSTADNET